MFVEKVDGLKPNRETDHNNSVVKRKWNLLLFCGFILFLAGTTVTLMIPFYSVEARGRDVSSELDGLIFGVYQLVMLVMSPVCGKYMGKIGSVRLLNVSCLLLVIGLVLFGFLELVPNSAMFVVGAGLFRAFQALSCTAVFASCFALISTKSVAYPGTMFAALQTFVCFGIAVGPTLGGMIYEFGGFHSPFFVIGGLLLILRGVSSQFLPTNQTYETQHIHRTAGVIDLLRGSSVAISSLGMLLGCIALGFICTALEPQLRQFSFSSTSIGAIMAINGLMFAITAPLWGYLCDKTGLPIIIQLVGNVLSLSAFILIGPAPFLGSNIVIFLLIVGLIVQGCGIAASCISNFCVALHNIRQENHQEADILVSTLWQSLMSLGIWIGSSISGILVSVIGFRNVCGAFILTFAIMTWIVGIDVSLKRRIYMKAKTRRYFSFDNEEISPLSKQQEDVTSKYGSLPILGIQNPKRSEV